MSIPAGYTPLPDGAYTKSDGSGPYVFDGTTMALAATGTGGGGGGSATSANQVTQITAAQATQVSAASIDAKTLNQVSVRQIDTLLNALTLNAAVTVTIDGGIGEVGFDITGLTATGAVITFEGTNNVGAGAPHWGAIQSVQGSTLSSTATVDGAFRVETGGRTAVRARISTIGSAGNITVSTATSQVGSLVTLAQGIPTVASSNVSSAAYEKSHVLSAVPARLLSLTGYNSGVAQFFQLHDAAALPADTAVPKIVFYVGAASSFSLDFGLRGRSFATGIVVCNSSTGPTKTLGATADSWFDAQIGGV